MSFEHFLDAELDRLRRYARVLTGDRDAAHDVLADVLIKAHLRWHRIGRMEHPGAYVRSMVTNGFLSDRRRWSNRSIRATRTGDLPDVEGVHPQASVDDRAQLGALLSALPRQQRAAIVLRYYLDLSDDDIAAELGCSAGAVRTYVSRGLTALRRRETDGAAGRPRAVTAPHGNPVGDLG